LGQLGVGAPSGRLKNRLTFLDSCQRDCRSLTGAGGKDAIGRRGQSEQSILHKLGAIVPWRSASTALAGYIGGTAGVSMMLILLASITFIATLFAKETKGAALVETDRTGLST
jgi:hypothetical protein